MQWFVWVMCAFVAVGCAAYDPDPRGRWGYFENQRSVGVSEPSSLQRLPWSQRFQP